MTCSNFPNRPRNVFYRYTSYLYPFLIAFILIFLALPKNVFSLDITLAWDFPDEFTYPLKMKSSAPLKLLKISKIKQRPHAFLFQLKRIRLTICLQMPAGLKSLFLQQAVPQTMLSPSPNSSRKSSSLNRNRRNSPGRSRLNIAGRQQFT